MGSKYIKKSTLLTKCKPSGMPINFTISNMLETLPKNLLERKCLIDNNTIILTMQ